MTSTDTPQSRPGEVAGGYTRPSAIVPLTEPLKRKTRVALDTFREEREGWEHKLSLREWLERISEGDGSGLGGDASWAWAYGRVDMLAELLGFSCDLTALAEAVGWDADHAEEWGRV